MELEVQSSLEVTFCCWIFFHVVKPLMPILMPINCVLFVKNRTAKTRFKAIRRYSPIDIISTKICKLTNNDINADNTPVITVATRGVFVKGWITPRNLKENNVVAIKQDL